MTEPPRRRPILIDAMILVAATALGMALSRPFLHWLSMSWELHGSKPRTFGFWARSVSTWGTVSAPCLLAWTFALPVLRGIDRGRRPAVRRGAVGLLATTGLVLVVAAISALLAEMSSYSWRTHTFLDNYAFHALQRFGELNGLAVGAVWLTAACSDRDRESPPPDWIEWLASLLGAVWIGLSILHFWLEPLASLLG